MKITTQKTLKNHNTMPKMAQLGRNRLNIQSSGVFPVLPRDPGCLGGWLPDIPKNSVESTTSLCDRQEILYTVWHRALTTVRMAPDGHVGGRGAEAP